MTTSDGKAARDRFLERVGDWSEHPPTVQSPEPWDWRTVDLASLDPIARRIVEGCRQRAAELGLPLGEAPDDPFILFQPPFPPLPDDLR